MCNNSSKKRGKYMKCAIDDTVEYVKLLAQRLGGCKPKAMVLVMLLDLGIPVNYSGFEYLKTAILLQFEDPTADLANDIYPVISAKTGKDISNEMIDTSIRNAIRSAWLRTNIAVWQKYIPIISDMQKKPPTNTEMIASLAKIVELWYTCAEAYNNQLYREEVHNGIV